MSMQHSNTADAWTPTDIGQLLNVALQAKSTAFLATAPFLTDKVKVSFPLWLTDPAVTWLGELEEIVATDGTTGEVTVIPKKIGGITRISNEIKEDTTPEIADEIGQALANQIAHGVDAAFLGNGSTGANAAKVPDGLLSVTGAQTVDTGAAVTNTDPFVSAIFKAQSVGAEIDRWIMAPSTAETLSKLKKASGSNENLIELVEDGLTVAGRKVLISQHVDEDTVAWGLDSRRTKTVLRKDTAVERFPAVYVDGIDIRAISRVEFAYLHPQSIVRLYDAS